MYVTVKVNVCDSSCEMSLICAGMAYNFYKIETLNQGTAYDYNSVMQYEKYEYIQVHFILQMWSELLLPSVSESRAFQGQIC